MFVKNTVPILRFVYQIAVVAVQEGGYSYRSSSEDKNGSKTCEGRFKSRILRYIYIYIYMTWIGTICRRRVVYDNCNLAVMGYESE